MPDRGGVVITGLGLILPHGVGLRAADDVFAGRSAVRRLNDIEGIPDATGARVPDFRPVPGTEGADRAVQFAVAAAEEALAGAGLTDGRIDPGRIASVITLSKGGLLGLIHMAEHGSDNGWAPWKVAPDAAATAVAHHFGLGGPVAAPITACASGGHALIWGARLIERGVVDAAVVGAAEASLHPLVIGSYRRMGVLASGGEDPSSSVRPFSATRRGFAIGEGAGILVLESESSATRRGARPLARILGWASGCQAEGLTNMEPGGEALAHLITEALRRAGVAASSLDYINAHGTATVENDLAESRAIRAALDGNAGRVSVSSTKGAHGHLLGAAAAVELAITVMAISRGEVPPTTNLTDPDPRVGLDCTPVAARRRRIGRALKIASGFGGQMLAAVLGCT